ncbi:MAG: HNH endonuclease [Betaproteobacteria bacterium AqS2]|uniref:HNH endonuclease n=1 Tax=Candidatus Amphirhobacter heronislandensis TaxID=1732024 RepID=A0A930UDL7_9GAMM|nr:HNH endonuclease [Betaproteobacteria bacterium AqS2]
MTKTKYEIKESLLEKHGTICQCCERDREYPEYLQIDRKLSGKDGGIYEESNCQLLCEVCNRLKGSSSPSDAIKKVKTIAKDPKHSLYQWALESPLVGGKMPANVKAPLSGEAYKKYAEEQYAEGVEKDNKGKQRYWDRRRRGMCVEQSSPDCEEYIGYTRKAHCDTCLNYEGGVNARRKKFMNKKNQ